VRVWGVPGMVLNTEAASASSFRARVSAPLEKVSTMTASSTEVSSSLTPATGRKSGRMEPATCRVWSCKWNGVGRGLQGRAEQR
jgi:hypothetical protein